MKKIAFFSPLSDLPYKYDFIPKIAENLSSKGRVLILDANPLCWLTSNICEQNIFILEDIYRKNLDIYSSVKPLFYNECDYMNNFYSPVNNNFMGKGIDFISGSPNIWEIESELSRAHHIAFKDCTETKHLKKITAFNDLLKLSCDTTRYDWVLIDLPSNFCSISQNLLMISDMYVSFFRGDFFGAQIADTFLKIIPKWNKCYQLLNSKYGILPDSKHKLLKSFIYPGCNIPATQKVYDILSKRMVISKLDKEYVFGSFFAEEPSFSSASFLVKHILDDSGIN